jgi:hypothetical protein
VLRAFREALGTERANKIAWGALAEWRRALVRDMHAGITGAPAERWLSGFVAAGQQVGDAVDVLPLKQTPEALEMDVTGCRFAELFEQLGEPELGFALLCAVDDTAAQEIGQGEVALTRTSTIMQGGARCDFRYALKRSGHP